MNNITSSKNMNHSVVFKSQQITMLKYINIFESQVSFNFIEKNNPLFISNHRSTK
jgi:hypothetical protein